MSDGMVDMNRFIELEESLRADEPPRGMSMSRLRLTYYDDDKPIFREMLAMLGDGVSIGDLVRVTNKVAVVKADDKIIMARKGLMGFMIYIDARDNLIGEEVDVFEVLSALRREV